MLPVNNKEWLDFLFCTRDALNRRPFYYTQSHEVHELLIGAGAFDDGEREVRMF